MPRRYIPSRPRHVAAPNLRNPVAMATLRAQTNRDITTLLSTAGIHALMGGDKGLMVYKLGWLFWVIVGGAGACGISMDEPDVRIIRSTANLLADLQECDTREVTLQERIAFSSAVNACQRLRPRITELAIYQAAARMQHLLDSKGSMGTADMESMVEGFAEVPA